jgi:hypothetical protein
MVHLVGFTTGIYNDARTYEHQNVYGYFAAASAFIYRIHFHCILCIFTFVFPKYIYMHLRICKNCFYFSSY